MVVGASGQTIKSKTDAVGRPVRLWDRKLRLATVDIRRSDGKTLTVASVKLSSLTSLTSEHQAPGRSFLYADQCSAPHVG